MDPRLPYAFAAMASIAPDGADNATVSQFTTQAMVVAAQLLKAPDGLHSIQSGRWLSPARSERDRLMCAVPVGIALSTIDPEAFARTVWFACGCTTRDEFQSAALLAAAVSLALDSYDAPAGEAVEFVAALPPRGEAEEGPDILTATRRAMNVLSNSKWVYYWSPINLLRQKLAAHSSSSLVIPLSFYIPPLSYSSAIRSCVRSSPAFCHPSADAASAPGSGSRHTPTSTQASIRCGSPVSSSSCALPRQRLGSAARRDARGLDIDEAVRLPSRIPAPRFVRAMPPSSQRASPPHSGLLGATRPLDASSS